MYRALLGRRSLRSFAAGRAAGEWRVRLPLPASRSAGSEAPTKDRCDAALDQAH